MSTDNLLALTLGQRTGKIKWDATWNVLAWLLDPRESHGLGDALVRNLSSEAFGTALGTCTIHPERPIGDNKEGKSKWPDLTIFFPNQESPAWILVMDDVDMRSPGSLRKINNLREYANLAEARFPNACVRVIAVTNAGRADEIERVTAVLRVALGPEGSGSFGSVPWRLIPLRTFGLWAHASRCEGPSIAKFSAYVEDFVAWSGASDEITSSAG